MLREDNILKRIEEEKETLVQKIKKMGQIGTELQIIESMSNEVSETFESQLVDGEIGTVSSRSKPELVVLSGSSGKSGTPSKGQLHQDQILEEIEKKNSKTLKMIQMEKRNQLNPNTQANIG